MKVWKKLLFVVALALSGKQAIGQVVAAGGGTAAVAGITAGQLGADPLPWIVGGFGAAIAFLLRQPATLKFTIAHSAISVFCGGVGAPWAATVVAHYVNPVLANDLVLAFALSIGWPVLVPLLMGWFTRVAGALPATKNGGQ